MLLQMDPFFKYTPAGNCMICNCDRRKEWNQNESAQFEDQYCQKNFKKLCTKKRSTEHKNF